MAHVSPDEDFSSYYVAPALSGPKAQPAWRGMYARSLVPAQPPEGGERLTRGGYDPGELGIGGIALNSAQATMAGAGVKLFIAYVAVQTVRGKNVPKWMLLPGAAMAVWAYGEELYGLFAQRAQACPAPEPAVKE